jgi:hypothetical protein
MTGHQPASHTDSLAAHWRSLVAAVAPVVAVALAVQGVLTAFTGVVVVDGVVLPRPGWQQWMIGVVWGIAWALSVGAAMFVVRGALIGAPVQAAYALKAAYLRWGSALAVLAVVAIAAIVLLFLGSLISPALGPFGIILIGLAVFVPSPLIGALPIAMLDGVLVHQALARAWELSVGRRWRMFWLCVGVAAPAAALGWASELAMGWAAGPVTAVFLELAVALAAVVVIAVQAGVLVRWRLRLDGARRLGTQPRPDTWRFGAALVLAAVLGSAALTAVNPAGMPVLSTSTVSIVDPASGVGLTADGRGFPGESGHPPLVWAEKRAAFPDGRTVLLTHNGTDQPVLLDECPPEGACHKSIRARMDRPGGLWEAWSTVAIGQGVITVAAVQETGTPADQADIVMWLCPTATCQASRRAVLYPGFGLATQPPYGPLQLALHLDKQGRPMVALLAGGGQSVTIVRCEDTACLKHSWDTTPLAAPMADAGGERAVVGLGFDRDDHLVAVLGVAEPQEGTHTVVPTGWRPQVATVTCLEPTCQDRQIRRWHETGPSNWPPEIAPVTLPDGSLVLVEHGSSGYRTIRCESHCS